MHCKLEELITQSELVHFFFSQVFKSYFEIALILKTLEIINSDIFLAPILQGILYFECEEWQEICMKNYQQVGLVIKYSLILP
jgi:hypothetical protein